VTVTCQSAEETARTIVERVGSEVVLGLPIGIGKATHVADALFELASQESSIRKGKTFTLPTDFLGTISPSMGLVSDKK